MPKILVKNPIVDVDGDEMARVLWDKIKKKLIFPFLELNLIQYDLSIINRDKSNDKVTVDAANAIKKYQVGVKCATITPDDKRVKEFKLKKKYPSPNGTIRNILKGTIFREPIIIQKVPKIVKHWNQPVIIARHAFGDIYRSKEIEIKKGELSLSYEDENKKTKQETIHKFDTPGIGLAYFNSFDSIRDFGKSCFNFALKRKFPLFLSTKNTILQKYDEAFKQTFDQLYNDEFKYEFEKIGITYQHRLIDDMVACLMKWSGVYVWACKNYDGDVMSDLVAQGYGSLGLMSSILQSPDGKVIETEAAHGTVTSHYRQHQGGKPTSTNPIASIFAWSRALIHRGSIDSNTQLQNFAYALEKSCLDSVNSGFMTKDLALMCGPNQKWLTTDQLIDVIKKNLDSP